jgi:hypothetical protein
VVREEVVLFVCLEFSVVQEVAGYLEDELGVSLAFIW